VGLQHRTINDPRTCTLEPVPRHPGVLDRRALHLLYALPSSRNSRMRRDRSHSTLTTNLLPVLGPYLQNSHQPIAISKNIPRLRNHLYLWHVPTRRERRCDADCLDANTGQHFQVTSPFLNMLSRRKLRLDYVCYKQR